MRVNSAFDELELVIKLTISSKTHKEKNQTRTKKDDARMQWFELSTNDTIKLLIESPPCYYGNRSYNPVSQLPL